MKIKYFLLAELHRIPTFVARETAKNLSNIRKTEVFVLKNYI